MRSLAGLGLSYAVLGKSKLSWGEKIGRVYVLEFA